MEERNFRDFLSLYNTLTELCFGRCVNNFHSRMLDQQESKCIEDCASKYIKFNNRLMKYFVVEQNKLMKKRLEEAEVGQVSPVDISEEGANATLHLNS